MFLLGFKARVGFFLIRITEANGMYMRSISGAKIYHPLDGHHCGVAIEDNTAYVVAL